MYFILSCKTFWFILQYLHNLVLQDVLIVDLFCPIGRLLPCPCWDLCEWNWFPQCSSLLLNRGFSAWNWLLLHLSHPREGKHLRLLSLVEGTGGTALEQDDQSKAGTGREAGPADTYSHSACWGQVTPWQQRVRTI